MSDKPAPPLKKPKLAPKSKQKSKYPKGKHPNFIATRQLFQPGNNANPLGCKAHKKPLQVAFRAILHKIIEKGCQKDLLPYIGKTYAEMIADKSLELLPKCKKPTEFLGLLAQVRVTAGEIPLQEVEVDNVNERYAAMSFVDLMNQVSKLVTDYQAPKQRLNSGTNKQSDEQITGPNGQALNMQDGKRDQNEQEPTAVQIADADVVESTPQTGNTVGK